MLRWPLHREELASTHSPLLQRLDSHRDSVDRPEHRVHQADVLGLDVDSVHEAAAILEDVLVVSQIVGPELCQPRSSSPPVFPVSPPLESRLTRLRHASSPQTSSAHAASAAPLCWRP